MNLRETFIWNALVGASVVFILYFGYLNYSNYQKYNKQWIEYSKEELGTDNELSNKIMALEAKLNQKEEYAFQFKNNPTDLRRIIQIEGMESYFGISSNDIKVLGRLGDRPIIQYKGKSYTNLTVGDTIAGGKIVNMTSKELTFVRGDEEILYPLRGN